MSDALRTPVTEKGFHNDRPGWIPPHIIDNWDKNPYAYQTEEESMPAGGLHGQIVSCIMETLKYFLKTQGLMLLMDIFVLYRDTNGIRQRFSPDLILMPFRSHAPSAYDLDIEPAPKLLMEVTSAKSHQKDLKNNVNLYSSLGVSTYLIIDAITPQDKLRQQIGLHLWKSEGGKLHRLAPDNHGFFLLPEMKVRIKAQGQNIILKNADTDEIFRDNTQFSIDYEQLKTDNKRFKLIAEQERQRAEKLAAKLRSLGFNSDDY